MASVILIKAQLGYMAVSVSVGKVAEVAGGGVDEAEEEGAGE